MNYPCLSLPLFGIFALNPLNRGPVFDLSRINGEWAAETDYKIFDCNGNIKMTGTPVFIPEEPLPGYMWDYSLLTSDGILRIKENPASAIDSVNADSEKDMIIYDLSGRRVDVITSPGIYIVNGKKMMR